MTYDNWEPLLVKSLEFLVEAFRMIKQKASLACVHEHFPAGTLTGEFIKLVQLVKTDRSF